MILLQPKAVMKYLFVPIVRTALENTKPFVDDNIRRSVRRTKPFMIKESMYNLREDDGFNFHRLQWNMFR